MPCAANFPLGHTFQKLSSALSQLWPVMASQPHYVCVFTQLFKILASSLQKMLAGVGASYSHCRC